MRDWVCKIKHAFLLTLQKNWVAIITFVFSILGIVYSISEFATDILNLTKTYEWVRGYLKIIIPIAILISFAKYWEKLQYSRFINGTDIKITLCVGNIIHQKNALVIPTNTTFDTIQDDEFISKTSVQGQFQEKYYRNNIRKLDNEICEGLKDQRPVTDTRRTHSKSNQYAIGTTCKITTHDQRHAYFLAIADINEKGKPINTKIENITDSLVSFWNFLNEEGHVETLAIPLIGTGKAGIKDATRDVIIKEIIFSFIVASKEMKVTEELLIYIHPSDFLKKNLHWHEMCEYLDYMCKFMTSDRTTLPVGEPDNNYARFA